MPEYFTESPAAIQSRMVAKNVQSERKGKKIMRENLQLLKILSDVQGEDVTLRLKKKLKRYKGPNFKRVRAEIRQSRQDQRQRENLTFLKHLQATKSVYSVDSMRKSRQKQEHFMQLRSVDHTRGHLMAAASVGSYAKHQEMAEKFRSLDGTKSTKARVRPATAPAPRRKPAPGKGNRIAAPSAPPGGDLKYSHKLDPKSTFEKLPPLNLDDTKKDKKDKSGRTKKKATEASPVDSPAVLSNPSERNNAAVAIEPSNQLCIHTKEKQFVVAAFDGIETIECSVQCMVSLPLTSTALVEYTIYHDQRQLAALSITIADAQKLMTLWEDETEQVDADDVLEMYEFLSQMFLEADQDGSGRLDREEFFDLLQDADLGINPAELHLVLAEADEDDDNLIDYVEFLPVAIDLVQSFKARSVAQAQVNKEEAKISDDVLRLLNSGHLDMLVQKAGAIFEESDTTAKGVLSRQEFKACLKKIGQDLTRVEINMVLANMPCDAFGKIKYSSFGEVAYKVRFITIKNSILETQASDTEKLLMTLCREEERSGMDLTDNEEPSYNGMITTIQLSNVLTNAKLSLNRLQVTSVMCEVSVDDGMVDYWKFIPIAAKAIDQMNNPENIQWKADILAQEQIYPEDFLKGKKEDELKEELHRLFDKYDADMSGELDQTEFEICLKELDLGLSKGQISALMAMADADNEGTVDKSEFMEFGFHHLVHLQREKHMRHIQSSLGPKADDKSDANNVVNNDPMYLIIDPNTITDDESMKTMEKDLITIFTRADLAGVGYLTTQTFRNIIDAMDLGSSPYQTAMLFAEADDNESGKVSFSEFVPTGLKMLYAYKAKQSALKKWNMRDQQAEDQAENLFHERQGQLDSITHEIELAFHNIDVSNGLETLPYESFVQCLKQSSSKLLPGEVNMIVTRMPADSKGNVSYKDFRAVMHEVRRLTEKSKILQKMASSTLEKHLIGEFQQHESEKREAELGYLPAKEVFEVMQNAKYLNINRQQLMAVMSLQKDCIAQDIGGVSSPAHASSTPSRTPSWEDEAESKKMLYDTDENIDYWRFACCASEMISKFFDVQEIERRAKMLSSAVLSPVNLLGGLEQIDLEKRLKAEFLNFDRRRTGLVGAEEFKRCIGTIKQLSLTEKDLSDLEEDVPKNDQGQVKWKEWMEDAFEALLGIAREKYMKRLEGDDPDSTDNVLHQMNSAHQGAEGGVSEQMVMTVGEKLLDLIELSRDLVQGAGLAINAIASPTSKDMPYTAFFNTPTPEDEKKKTESPVGSEGDMRSPKEANKQRRHTRRASVNIRQATMTRVLGNFEESHNVHKLFRMSRKCPVVVESGVSIAANISQLSEFDQTANLAFHMIVVDVRSEDVSAERHIVSVNVLDLTDGEQYKFTRKLPTLAMADEEVATQWARQIANRTQLQKSEDGTIKLISS